MTTGFRSILQQTESAMQWVYLALLCASVVYSTPINPLQDKVKANPNLKWFSFWEVDNLQDMVGMANFLFVNTNETVAIEAHKLGLKVLWDVEGTLFHSTSSGLALKPDYQAQWSSASKIIGPYIQNATVMGLFLGDELCWNGLPYTQLETAVNMVRHTFPSAIIYYNEAYPVFTSDKNGQGKVIGYTLVPSNLDWISIDFYPDEGTLNDAKNIYHSLLYPKMAKHQSALYVPPAYGTTNDPKRFCGDADCTKAMLEWAHGAYSWAQEDTRIIGLNPWHWKSYSAAVLNGFEIGAKDMPKVKALWNSIGHQIITK